MTLPKHIKEHIELNLDFRFPANGNTYFKFTSTKVELYVDGTLVQEWS